MRNIIESTLVSLDGVIGDLHLWAMNYFDYGHGQTLLEHQLLDELRFWIHPLIVGRGKLLFREGEKTI